MTPSRLLFASAAAALSLSSSAFPNARNFAYTYESAVLPAGRHELEFWTTWRNGRAGLYSRFDQRVEFEVGVTDRLLSAYYLNWHRVTEEIFPGYDLTTADFDGVSSEWKYKLSDPTADALGFALYGEATANTDELELELKLIADKTVGPALVAYNAVLEPEAELAGRSLEVEEVKMEHVLAASFPFGPGFAAGAEIRQPSVLVEGALEHATLFAGPVLHFASGEFWITASALFQLRALKRPAGSPPGRKLDLDEFERVNARLLVSLPF